MLIPRIPQRHPRTCLDCGFLGFKDGAEAGAAERLAIDSEHASILYDPSNPIDCQRRMWTWYDTDDHPANVIAYECQIDRTHCRGFLQHSPGRPPKEHFTLEDDARSFKRQAWLALLAFFGGLFGAVLGGLL
jgi:hypothetical protein